MSDASPPPPAADAASPPAATPARVPRRRVFWRWTQRLLALLAALLATLIVTFFSIDLGQIALRGKTVRTFIETQGSKFLERPMRVGRVSALLTPGDFALDDLVIEGRTPDGRPDARPFFTAKRVKVHVPWWTLFHKELILEVSVTDYAMVVEKWVNMTNVPNLKPKGPPGGPKWYKPSKIQVNFVFADRGSFIYDDHVTPWSVIARDLKVDISHAPGGGPFIGIAKFVNGTVQIQNYQPMRADFATRFTVEGGLVHLHYIDLVTDGAVSKVTGELDFSKWPEQTYQVESVVNFPRMHDIFFAKERWSLFGEGRFKGVFHISKTGYDLRGDFASAMAGVSEFRFPNLRGSLEWMPGRFAVTHADSDLYGGALALTYALDGIGTPRGSTATFTAKYQNVNMESMGPSFGFWTAIQPAGRATGHVKMTWPNGHFGTGLEGDGETTVTPPDGVTLATKALPPLPPVAPPLELPSAATAAAKSAPPPPFDDFKPLGALPIGGHVTYRFTSNGMEFGDSWAATNTTYVEFRGQVAGDQSRVPFHVTSTDWQVSDRILAAIMTATSGRTGAIEVSGRGLFDGVMTQSFSRPRIVGRFDGEALRAWGVTWGRARADLVIQDRYVEITNGLIGEAAPAPGQVEPGPAIQVDGKFSLGYRKDDGDEITARVRATRWPMRDFRKAFQLDVPPNDWPLDGLVTTDLNMTRRFRHPFGSGQMRIDKGVAWGETFETATAALEFEGNGVTLRQIEIVKGTGRVTASAWMNWVDGTYVFDATGTKIPVESLTRFSFPQAPLTGVLQFHAAGEGAFAHPVFEFDGRVEDLFAGDEGIGQVVGHMIVRDNVVAIDRLEARSTRLDMSGRGKITLNDKSDADLTLTFRDTSLDPYLKFLSPKLAPQASPFLRATVSGSVRVFGSLTDSSQLLVDTTVTDAKLRLFDYDLANQGDVKFTFEDNVITIGRFVLTGDGTRDLELSGTISPAASRVALAVNGTASLAILQALGSFREIEASGTALLSARIEGDYNNPVFLGSAVLQDGRIRHRSLPHSLDGISGRITFDTSGIDASELRGRMGGGDVTFGGNITLKGFVPDEYNLTARGTGMTLRYPEGFQSTVDADLQLRGPVGAPTLSGNIEVLRATYSRPIDTDLTVLGLAAGGDAELVGGPGTGGTGFPLTFDVSIHAGPTTFIDRKNAKLYGHADLTFRGTYDRPVVTGQIDIDGAEVLFNGNWYKVTNGVIAFRNPFKIEPFFDIEAETRPHTPGQTYLIQLRLTGTFDQMTRTLTSDPYLPDLDIVGLLLGQAPSKVGSAEQRGIASPQESQAKLVELLSLQLLTAPLSSRVGSVFEKALPIDSFVLTPVLGNESALQQLNPTARVIVGKQISSRVFLTYSMALNASQSEVVLLEFDQSDRVSWVVSRNENGTFAIDFRIRYVFK